MSFANLKTKLSDDGGYRLSPSQKKLLQEREELYEKGEGKSYCWTEAQAIIRKSRKKLSKYSILKKAITLIHID